MKPEYDEYLVNHYPKLFRDRYKPMTETCMCWGFSHGSGWFNIIKSLCSNIQHHINWSRKNRASALQYNRCLKRALAGNNSSLIWYFTPLSGKATEWTYRSVEESVTHAKLREVPDACQQVIVDQVKEKFGTLRFYYHGGDDTVDGMVRMAEAMSGCTCEQCGNPATTSSNGGWVSTRCQPCKDAKLAAEECV
jgi:hypothetical protein